MSSMYSAVSFVRMAVSDPPLKTLEGPAAALIQEREEIFCMYDGKITIPLPFREQIWSSVNGFTIDDKDASEVYVNGTMGVVDVVEEFSQPSDLTGIIQRHPFILKVQFPVTLVRTPVKPLFADYKSRTIGSNRAKIMLNARLARRLPLTFTVFGCACACVAFSR